MGDTTKNKAENPPDEALAPRIAAARCVDLVTHSRLPLDKAIEKARWNLPDPKLRAFAYTLATCTLRRHGQIGELLRRYLHRPLPRNAHLVDAVLRIGVSQVLFLRTADHAAISTSVDLGREFAGLGRYQALINAVLRAIGRDKHKIAGTLPPAAANFPGWLRRALRADLGEDNLHALADSVLEAPELDITPRDDPEFVARCLGGTVLPTGTVRLAGHSGQVDALPGFGDGLWWVQDAAAAIPARLLGDVTGLRTIDLCAAPGGKAMQLAAAGAKLTVMDRSENRLATLRKNFLRTNLEAEIILGDVLQSPPRGKFDAVLLDAPCTGIGTIRRHPDILHVRQPGDMKSLVGFQRQLLRKAADLVKPGGRLVYAVCTVLAIEGSKQVQGFLSENRDFSRDPIREGEYGIPASLIDKRGDFRSLPHQELGEARGLDGFFASRLYRRTS